MPAAVCPICDGDGWYADGEFADEGKTKIRMLAIACPLKCPLDPESLPQDVTVLPARFSRSGLRPRNNQQSPPGLCS
jgi:hypothetical protein